MSESNETFESFSDVPSEVKIVKLISETKDSAHLILSESEHLYKSFLNGNEILSFGLFLHSDYAILHELRDNLRKLLKLKSDFINNELFIITDNNFNEINHVIQIVNSIEKSLKEMIDNIKYIL